MTTHPSRSRERPAWLIPVAVIAALAALLIGGAALLSSGDDSGGGGDDAEQQDVGGRSESGGESGAGEEASPPTGGGGGEAAPAPAPGAGGATSPEQAVQSFYTLAANDDFEGAWALAGPSFQAQLGGYDGFVGELSSLQSITFEKVKTKGSAEAPEVEIETVATHTDRVDECKGKLHLVRGETGWLIDRAESIECERQ